MEPEYGTPKYKEQVERILKVLTGSGVTENKHIEGIMLLYVMDMSYSRAAICEAEKRYRREVLAKQPPTGEVNMSYQPEWHLPKDHQLPSNGGEPPLERKTPEDYAAEQLMLRRVVAEDLAWAKEQGALVPDEFARTVQRRLTDLKMQLIWDMGLLFDLQDALKEENGPLNKRFAGVIGLTINKISVNGGIPVYRPGAPIDAKQFETP